MVSPPSPVRLSRVAQGVIPDRLPGAVDCRDVPRMREHGVRRGCDAQPFEVRGLIGERIHLDARDVLEAARVIRVAAAAVRGVSELALDVLVVRQEPIPLRWDASDRGAAARAIRAFEAEDQERIVLHEAGRGELAGERWLSAHGQCVLQMNVT